MPMEQHQDPDNNFGLDPAAFYRWSQGFKLFGLKHSQLCEAVKTGKLPPPMESAEGGKAKGWTGSQIIRHRRERFAAAHAAQQLGQPLAEQRAQQRAQRRALKGKQPATAE
jgi:hypothetical protein